MKNHKVLDTVCSILFVLVGIIPYAVMPRAYIIYPSHIVYALFAIGYIGVAALIFFGKREYLFYATLILVVASIISLFSSDNGLWGMIIGVINCETFVLLALSSINKGSMFFLSYIAIIPFFDSKILDTVLLCRRYTIYNLLVYFLFAAAIILFGICLSRYSKEENTSREFKLSNTKVTHSDFDRLIELKKLLDAGIISQEEFEAIKNSILH